MATTPRAFGPRGFYDDHQREARSTSGLSARSRDVGGDDRRPQNFPRVGNVGHMRAPSTRSRSVGDGEYGKAAATVKATVSTCETIRPTWHRRRCPKIIDARVNGKLSKPSAHEPVALVEPLSE